MCVCVCICIYTLVDAKDMKMQFLHILNCLHFFALSVWYGVYNSHGLQVVLALYRANKEWFWRLVSSKHIWLDILSMALIFFFFSCKVLRASELLTKLHFGKLVLMDMNSKALSTLPCSLQSISLFLAVANQGCWDALRDLWSYVIHYSSIYSRLNEK